ncbi:MAG: hypothetical protein E7058_08310 [Lentisphaerae bacterium]|nr:hypothetical protein [Lentisphaerota bacterium]
MKKFTAFVLLAAFAAVPQLSWGNPPDDKVQKIRFMEDDGQNYMTSKIYTLKHQKPMMSSPLSSEQLSVMRKTPPLTG